MVEIIVPIGAFSMVFGIVYVSVTSVHRQNMEMIARGMNPKISKKKSNLKDTLSMLFIPVGLLVAYFLEVTKIIHLENHRALLYIVSALFFVGLGHLLAYKIENKKSNSTIEL